MMDAFLGNTPCAGETFAEGGGRDDGEGVAVVAFAGVGRRWEMGGALRGGLNGLEVVGSVVVGFGVGGEMVFAVVGGRLGIAVVFFSFLFFGEPAFGSG